MKPKEFPGQKIICLNRIANFNYFFLELIEAGIALKGSEVKSIRDGKVSIADSYAVDKDGDPSYQGIDQSKLVPLLVGAIQELKAEVDLLKQECKCK